MGQLFTERQAAEACGMSLREFRRTVKEMTASGELPIRTLKDEDCPGCGWPETIDVRDGRTGRVVRRECGARKQCGWEGFKA
jgi:hypothetical protein